MNVHVNVCVCDCVCVCVHRLLLQERARLAEIHEEERDREAERADSRDQLAKLEAALAAQTAALNKAETDHRCFPLEFVFAALNKAKTDHSFLLVLRKDLLLWPQKRRC